MDQIRQIPLDQIKVGSHEQRLDKEDLDTIELAASIRRIGIISPLIVGDTDGSLYLIAGHRRLTAARMAGLKDVPCIVRRAEKDLDAEVTFAENFFRKDLSPVELAAAMKDCLENGVITAAEMAAGFHRKEYWVHSMIAIAGWPGDVQEALHNGFFSVSAAANLAMVEDDTYREFLIRNAAEAGATARTTAAWLQAWRAMQPAEQAITAEPVPAGNVPIPMVPQAPCLSCSQIFPVNQMSHVPLCGACIQIIRTIGNTQA